MNLIANGCSFTAGVPQDKDHLKFMETKTNIGDFHCFGRTNSTAWPYQIPGMNVYNIANGGTGNHRILRTTLALLDMVPQDFIDDSVFVIQWSSVFRREFWTNIDTQIEIHDIDAYELVLPYSVTEEYDNQSSVYDEVVSKETLKILADHKFLATTLNQHIYDSMIALTTLTHALENKGARYLYTALQWNNLGLIDDYYLSPIPENHEFSPYIKALHNMVPMDNVLKSISNFLWDLDPETINNDRKYYIKDDGHPNDEGNRLFANYVKEELEKRNWLT